MRGKHSFKINKKFSNKSRQKRNKNRGKELIKKQMAIRKKHAHITDKNKDPQVIKKKKILDTEEKKTKTSSKKKWTKTIDRYPQEMALKHNKGFRLHSIMQIKTHNKIKIKTILR